MKILCCLCEGCLQQAQPRRTVYAHCKQQVFWCVAEAPVNVLTKVFEGESIMCKKLLILTSFVFMLGLVGNAVGQPTG
ncbi:MAG: hypothetical protein ACYSW0_07640, partial [Planctomycetota bacterium]